MVQKLTNSGYAFQKRFTRSFVQYLHFTLNITKTTYHSGLCMKAITLDTSCQIRSLRRKHDGKRAANFLLINLLLGFYLLAGSGLALFSVRDAGWYTVLWRDGGIGYPLS